MATVNYTHICGHAGKPITGSSKEAHSRAAWAAGQVCWDCRRAEQTRSAVAMVEVAGLPQLTGSPKQIAYGEVKRAERLQELDSALASIRGRAVRMAQPRQGEWLDALVLLEDELRGQTNAKYWIELSGDLEYRLVEQVKARGLVSPAKTVA